METSTINIERVLTTFVSQRPNDRTITMKATRPGSNKVYDVVMSANEYFKSIGSVIEQVREYHGAIAEIKATMDTAIFRKVSRDENA